VTAEASATEETAEPAGAKNPRHARRPNWPIAVLRTARPRQWPKNLLVFAAPLAGATWGRPHGALYALVAAAAFCCASVAVYFINDVVDAERDRQHPRKRFRPVAAGDLPKSHAVVIGVLCAAAGLSAGLIVSVPLLTAAVGAYLGISFLYSFVLKHIPVVELIFVASGFLLRVLGGAAATHVPPSAWFLVVCSLGALGVAVAKRYTELAGLGPAAIQAWAAGERTDAQPWHLISAVPLAAALIRFGMLTKRHTAAPVEDLLTRNGLMLTCELTWLALFVTGLQA
jgi:decaprenyl-phosphate phosphoribosyltransferase